MYSKVVGVFLGELRNCGLEIVFFVIGVRWLFFILIYFFKFLYFRDMDGLIYSR